MQITTIQVILCHQIDCYLYHKDTKLNANHNGAVCMNLAPQTATYITKILN